MTVSAQTIMGETIALWWVDRRGVTDVVRAACSLLLAGFDTPAVCELAAESIHGRDDDIGGLIDAVLHDLGLPSYDRSTPAAAEAGLRVVATQVLRAAVTPRELCAWAHARFGHNGIDAAQPFVTFDDEYDLYADHTTTFGNPDTATTTPADELLDHQVRDAARRLITSPRPTGPTW